MENAKHIPQISHELNKRTLKEIGLGEEEKGRLTHLYNDVGFWKALGQDELLEFSRLLIANGLFDKGLSVLSYLNDQFPSFVEGWHEHASFLSILGDREKVAAIHAKARLKGVELDLASRTSPMSDAIDVLQRDVELEEPSDQDLSEFSNFRAHEKGISRYMELFKGREDCFARQWRESSEGRVKTGYYPVRRPMTDQDVQDHISGRCTYGIYILNRSEECAVGVIDCDIRKGWRDEKGARGDFGAIKREAVFVLKRIDEISSDLDLRCLVEFSGGKGYHVWYPVESPVPAGYMKGCLEYIAGQAGHGLEFFSLEVFPKQVRLTGKGLGNLVKLPLGVHRGTGRRSFFLSAPGQDIRSQFAFIRSFKPYSPDAIRHGAARIEGLMVQDGKKKVVPHPVFQGLKDEFPELMDIEAGCHILSKLIAMGLRGVEMSERERKILIGTLGHLRRGRDILHRILGKCPDYDMHILNYELSRLRGTPLGCKRIHGLAGEGSGGIDCTFQLKKGEYAHPLLHIVGWEQEQDRPKAERIQCLKDAIVNLKTAIEILERYI
ncbi:MAG TPA: hypothetical protein ENJ63_02805 [Dissulfuribacter thermophilus]|uniref:TOTE conflict system primase domain-containing protein n=1 Tax=Dissulfuribacter thermophilus TaxID=1156395 RepID=A0A7V2SW65_9BACT|nr:hypothetical protein [Dissulfuribacter thermophilus]